MKILVINGPNLDLLDQRDKQLYGALNLHKIQNLLEVEFPEVFFEFNQTYNEFEFSSMIRDAQSQFDGIVINPGGFSHTSIIIRDSIDISNIPIIEVHLSNISSREYFRNNLITAAKTIGYVSGFKEYGYLSAVYILKKIYSQIKN